MPVRAKSACSCPSCPACLGHCSELVTSGRCGSCKSQAQAAAPHDKDRKKVYNSARWKGLRRTVQRENPWCAVEGCGQLWTQLDHEPPLRDLMAQGLDPFSRETVQGLCAKHHSAKTLAEMRTRREANVPPS